jgi:nicotinamidase-related amidase
MRVKRSARILCLGAAVIISAAAASANDIIDEWGTAKVPPKPELKAVTLDPKTTALLLLDLNKNPCSQRPRCLASVPNAKRLHDVARAAGAMVYYTSTPADFIDQSFAPKDGEWANTRGPDKYLGSDLDAHLKARQIKTVIVCGTSAQGVVIGTGSGSAQRGYKVVVPVDCMSSEDPYMEQYAAWHMYKGGPAVVTGNTTLTRSTMVRFQ